MKFTVKIAAILAVCYGVTIPLTVRASAAENNRITGKTGEPTAKDQKASDQKASDQRVTADYVLGPDDVLEISVSNHPDLNRTVTVRADGLITFPRVGDLKAQGQTPRSLATKIQSLLERSLNNARVEIIIKETRPQKARIIGAIKNAGSFDIKADWHIMDLVAVAGGLSAKPVRISGRIMRGKAVIPFDIEEAVTKPASAANLLLETDDVVVLDERSVAKQISVTGKVNNPGAYDLEENLTIISLLAQAGGPAEGAALKKAHVLREGNQIPLDLTETVNQGKTKPEIANFKFQPGDVLMIPENQARYGVMGKVVKPSYFVLPEQANAATALKALAQAGGPLPDADLANATVTRVGKPTTKILPVDIEAMVKGRAPDTFLLQEDDVLYVPEKVARVVPQVHVVGEMGKTGAFELKENLNLMTLLSEAGGASASAGLDKAYILRNNLQIPLNLYSVLIDGKNDPAISNFKLVSGDVLVVPPATKSQIHVVGQIAKPGAYELKDGMTVMSLMSEVGSASDKAALSNSYILRDGKRLPMDLNKALVTGVGDPTVASFKFLPGDVLVIPENQLRFAVMGQVGKPGYFKYPEQKTEATILKALSEAGGPIQSGENRSDLANAGIIRTVNGEATVTKINIDEILKKGNLANNVQLEPEDILYIPVKGRGFKWTDLLTPLSALSFLGIGR